MSVQSPERQPEEGRAGTRERAAAVGVGERLQACIAGM